MKRCSQGNYWEDLQQKYYGDSQIKNMRGREREDEKKIGIDKNIS